MLLVVSIYLPNRHFQTSNLRLSCTSWSSKTNTRNNHPRNLCLYETLSSPIIIRCEVTTGHDSWEPLSSLKRFIKLWMSLSCFKFSISWLNLSWLFSPVDSKYSTMLMLSSASIAQVPWRKPPTYLDLR